MEGEPPFDKARVQAFRWLAARPRSERELRRKLQDKGYGGTVIDRVIADLYESAYLDDGAFARQWARTLAVSRRLGNRRIEISLQEKGIGREIIKEVLDSVREEMPEQKVVRALIRKKTGGKSFSSLAARERARIIRSLLGKGFSHAAIREVIDQPLEDFVQ